MPAFASIAYVSGTTGGGGCTISGTLGSGFCPVTYSPTTGNAVALFFRPNSGATTSYVQDNNIYTMQQGSAVPFNAGYSIQSFAMFAKAGATSYTVSELSTNNGIVLGEYSGVLSFNLAPTLTGCTGGTITKNVCTGTGTLASVTFTLDDANDYGVCGFTQGGTNGLGVWQAPFTGTLRQSYASNPTMVLVDNTAASGSITIAASLASSSTWRATCIELRTVANPQTFNILQITPQGYGSLTGPTGCTVTGLTCTWQVAPTTAGSLLVFPFSDHSDFNDIQRTITKLVTCSALTGGICDGIHNNVDVSPAVVLSGPACQAYVQDTQPESDSQDTAFVLSGAGGANFVTATRSGSNPTSERQGYALIEVAGPNGMPWVLDTCGTASIATPASSFNITGAGINGKNDVIVQGITGGLYAMNITPPYLQGEAIPNHQGFWVGTGLTSGSAPIITVGGVTNGAAGVARAFTLVGPPAPPGIFVTGGISAQGGIVATPAASSIGITTTSPLPNCTQTIPFTFPFNAAGGVTPYTWSLFSGTLQPGLSLASTGVLSGTCSNNTGTATFTVQVCDAGSPAACITGSFQQTAQNTPPPTLVVCNSTSTPSCPNPPSTGIVGTFYSYNFSVIGGTAPYAWTVSAGAIPAGLTLSSAGVLSGFPSSAATFSYTVLVTDSTSPTPETATAPFSAVISGFSGNPAVAKEPQSWVAPCQGGQNLSTGNPCTQSDATGSFARNLPKVCDSGHNCKHEQLGFGTNDHPATLAGLYQAGCDWTQLGQGNYLWVEMKKGVVLSASPSLYVDPGFGIANAMYVAPIKLKGIATPMPTGLTCPTSTTSPIGPYSLAGSVTSGTFLLGETVCQQNSLACAPIIYISCTLGSGSNPAPWVSGFSGGTSPVLPDCSDAGDAQIGPFSLGMFTGGTPDATNTDLWIGQTSGSVFTQSAQATSNGYFRLTTECDDSNTNIPCTGLADQVPCFHSILDSSIVNNPLCSNDLPSMFTFEGAIAVNNSNQIEQAGPNTALSGFEVTIQQGQNQSMNNTVCPAGVQCGFSPQLISVDCTSCGRDHYWAHGWDPGDPALHAGDPSQLSFSQTHYPVTPGTSPAQYNCPSLAYFSTSISSTSNPPIALSASSYAPYNAVQYANGCGDDVVAGVNMNDGGYGWDEFYVISKIHKNNSESHDYSIGNASVVLNPNGQGINGPHQWAQFIQMGTSEGGQFFGGSPVNPVSGVATNEAVHGFRVMADPGYRYLTGGSGHSPLAGGIYGGGYGCSPGTAVAGNLTANGTATVTWSSGQQFVPGIAWVGATIVIGSTSYTISSVPSATQMVMTGNVTAGGAAYSIAAKYLPNLCSMNWAMKKHFEIKWCVQCAIDGFILEMMWPDGQTGEVATFDSRVCSGGDDCGIFKKIGTPMTETADITVSNFIMRNSAGGPSFAPRSGGPGNGGGVSAGMDRVHLVNGLIYNLDQNQFGGSKGGDAFDWGGGGNTFSNGKASRTSNIASISFDVGTVAPNPLSHIQSCGAGPSCSTGGGTPVTIPPGTLYVNFNGQREDPISPQTCVGGICTPGVTGPCFLPDGTTQIPCGTVVFSGGTYDSVWGILTGTTPPGTIQTMILSAGGLGYRVGDVFTVLQGSASGGTGTVTSVDPSGNGNATAISLTTAGQLYTTANGLPTTGGHGGGLKVNITVAPGGIFDCRTLPCSNTQGTTNIWAPMCNAGTGATSMEVGSACHNCGASGNSQCPPIGCGDVSCVTGFELPSDIICNGTGGTGCGPANSTFQTYAFSILDISPGDIVNVTNCSDSSFNQPLHGYPSISNAYACTIGQNGCTQNQNPANLTVLFPNTGSNTSGVTGCQINNGAGWQRNFIVDHLGLYTGGQMQLNATLFGVGTQQENSQLTNSIAYFGGFGKGIYCGGSVCKNSEASHIGAGSATSYQSFDQTTNQVHHNAFALPSAGRAGFYTAVGLNGSTICPSDPTPGNCTGSSTAPLTPFCTGATQSVDTHGNPLCIGFVGFLSKSAFPSTLYNAIDCTDPVLANCPLVSPPWGSFDYHNFALCPSCASGSAPNLFSTMATDGLQLGPCLANSSTNCTNSGLGTAMISIDKALTRLKYTCVGTCGTGPWPD